MYGSARHDAPFPRYRCAYARGLRHCLAQSIYLYVAPGASVYVTPTPNGAYNGAYYNGAPAVYPEVYPGPYATPAPVVAAPLPAPVYSPAIAPPYLAPAPTYGPTYDAPLQAYGAAPGLVMQRRSMSIRRRGREYLCRMAGGRRGRNGVSSPRPATAPQCEIALAA